MRYLKPHLRSYVWDEKDTDAVRERYLQAYAKHIDEYVADGWNPFLLTITFRQLSGKEGRIDAQFLDQQKWKGSKKDLRIRSQMLEEAERIIWWISRAMVRNPWSDTGWEKLPRLFYSLDWPVRKRNKKLSKRIMTVNDGVHIQGILLKRRSTLLKQRFVDYVRENQKRLLGKFGKVDEIDVEPIDRTPQVAGQYILKAYKRRLVEDSGIMTLPYALSEMKSRNSKVAYRSNASKTSNMSKKSNAPTPVNRIGSLTPSDA